jgi:hypothetical protein
MTTIANLKETTKYSYVETQITEQFELSYKSKAFNIGKSNSFGQITTYTFTIENEEILNTLRQLYVATTNNFVKQVVKTVGQSKTFTNKQLDIVADELAKFETITINF